MIETNAVQKSFLDRMTDFMVSRKVDKIKSRVSNNKEVNEVKHDLNQLRKITEKLDEKEKEISTLTNMYKNLFNSLWNSVMIFEKKRHDFVLKDLNTSAKWLEGVIDSEIHLGESIKSLFSNLYGAYGDNCELFEKMSIAYTYNTKEICDLYCYNDSDANGNAKYLYYFRCVIYCLEESDVVIVFENMTEQKNKQVLVEKKEAVLDSIKEISGVLNINGNTEKELNSILKILGRNMKVDRTYIFRNHVNEEGQIVSSHTNEWCVDTVECQLNNPDLNSVVLEDAVPRWSEWLQLGHAICGQVKDFPYNEREILEPQNIQSICVVPIFQGKEFWGFLGFDVCNRKKVWSFDEENLLHTVSRIIGMSLGE